MEKSSSYIKNIFRAEGMVLLFFLLLLFFGKFFSKFQIIGPLYLHDALLLFITILALNRGKMAARWYSILILLIISFIYLVISLLLFRLPANLIVIAFRQYGLFLYLGCCYIIFNCLIRKETDLPKPIYLIRLISLLSVWGQVIYMIYGFIFIPGFSLFKDSDYNYFSPLAVFGIVTYSAMVLAYEPQTWKKILKFILAVFLSTTLGHSSAFFAVFVVLLIYFFVRITPIQRFIAVGLCIGAVLLLWFLPEFRDANASWRLLYWKHVMHNVIYQRYLLFGNGFGKPYMTYDYALYINEVIHSPIMIDEYYPMARYLAPPHNSFITIMFHVGLLPAMLLLLPLRGFFRQVFLKAHSSDPSANFMVYALTGCIVWVCFNVILELPHSATYFWLVYFTAACYLKKKPA